MALLEAAAARTEPPETSRNEDLELIKRFVGFLSEWSQKNGCDLGNMIPACRQIEAIATTAVENAGFPLNTRACVSFSSRYLRYTNLVSGCCRVVGRFNPPNVHGAKHDGQLATT